MTWKDIITSPTNCFGLMQVIGLGIMGATAKYPEMHMPPIMMEVGFWMTVIGTGFKAWYTPDQGDIPDKPKTQPLQYKGSAGYVSAFLFDNKLTVKKYVPAGFYQEDPSYGEGIAVGGAAHAVVAMPGDMIVKGSDGSYYPIRPEVFESLFKS